MAWSSHAGRLSTSLTWESIKKEGAPYTAQVEGWSFSEDERHEFYITNETWTAPSESTAQR